MSLARLMQSGQVWRADQRAVVDRGIPCEHAALQQLIGGWPRGALSEVLSPNGLGAGLLLPALVRLLREQPRWLLWVAPPYLPYAPGLRQQGLELGRCRLIGAVEPAQILWAAEQAMRAGDCAAVLAWYQGSVRPAEIRRLQLAAEQGDCLGVLFRPLAAASESSPAALRLAVRPAADGLEVGVLKQRGARAGRRIQLSAEWISAEARV